MRNAHAEVCTTILDIVFSLPISSFENIIPQCLRMLLGGGGCLFCVRFASIHGSVHVHKDFSENREQMVGVVIANQNATPSFTCLFGTWKMKYLHSA